MSKRTRISCAHNNRWSALLIVVAAIAIVSTLMSAAWVSYQNSRSAVDKAEKRIYATNIAKDGVEFAKAYIMTQTNKDRVSGWQKNVSGLSGNYRFFYDVSRGGYVAESTPKEIVEVTDPFYEAYERTVSISNWPAGTDEKQITVFVSYQDDPFPVQFTTTHTKVYAK